MLIGGAALLSAARIPSGAARAGDSGAAVIQQYASLPDDPWAVCHGVRGIGRDFAIKGGRRAVDFLLETHLAALSVNGRIALAFPIQVEVHPNSFLKTFLEAGVPLDYEFTHRGSRRTLRDVVDGARALFRPAKVSKSANMLPWSLIAFSRTTPAVKPRWTNAWDEPVDFDQIVEASLRLLETASAPLADLMRENKPETAKGPIHEFTCGGTHMVYGLLCAMQGGFVGSDRVARMQKQVDILVWRLNADLPLIDRFYREKAGLLPSRDKEWYELDAKLKLLGHAEECLALGTQRGVIALTPAQQSQRRVAVASIRRMLDEMEERNLGTARSVNPELFQQLVGDACHARHGLMLT